MTPQQAEYIKSLSPPDSAWGGLGALPLSPDPRDYDVRSLPGVLDTLTAGVPDSVDLSGFIRGEIYNQQATGACVAFSSGHCCSIDEVIEAGKWDPINCAEVYRRAGGTGQNGVDSRLVLQQAIDQGMPLTSGGTISTIQRYAFVPQQPGIYNQTIKAALATGYPMVLALLLPNDFGWQSGHGAVTSGYHQICLIGYQGDYWLFVNSWGAGWPGNSPHPGVGSILMSFPEANNCQNLYSFSYTVTPKAVPNPTPIPTPTPTPTPTPVPVPPKRLIVSGYTTGNSIPLAKAGEKLLVQGQNLGGGNLFASWNGQDLPVTARGDSGITVTMPVTAGVAPVHVRVEGSEADGPLLAVAPSASPTPNPQPNPNPQPDPGPQPQPGGLKVTLYGRRYSRGLVGVWAWVQEADGATLSIVWESMEVPGVAEGLTRIDVPRVTNPVMAKYVQATVQGSVGGVPLDAHQAQANGTPAVWQLGGVPSPATITVTAVDAQGRSGQASSPI